MPSYSVGKQKKSSSFINQNNFPGVGAYQTEKRSFDSTFTNPPSYGIGKTKKAKTQKSEVPGPNVYHTQKNSPFENKNRGFHLVGKVKLKTTTDIPGPAQYDTFLPYKKKQFSFGIKLKQKNSKAYIPGPSTYSPQLSKQSPYFSFEKSKRAQIGYQTTRVPGPGQYEKNGKESQKNCYSFAKGQKFEEENLIRRLRQFPGEFNYNTLNINIIKKKAMALKFGKGKREKSSQNLIPGPGHYRVKTIEKFSPRATIGNSPKSEEKHKNRSPGPADYNIFKIDKILKKQPQVKFSKSPRNSDKESKSPGPGAYEISLKESSISFRMRGRKSVEEKAKSPGPQEYNPKYETLLKKAQAFKIGEKLKMKKVNQIPGPGQYELNGIKKQRLYSFKKQVKKDRNNHNPGPGTYNIKGIIGSEAKI